MLRLPSSTLRSALRGAALRAPSAHLIPRASLLRSMSVAANTAAAAPVATEAATQAATAVATPETLAWYETYGQYAVDFIHTTFGLPWWASIVATTLCIRALVFPVAMTQARKAGLMQLAKPELEKLTQEFKKQREYYLGRPPPEIIREQQARMAELWRKYKTSPLATLGTGFIQLPLFIVFFFSLRNLHVLHPDVISGGFSWVTDLSLPDPYYILPALSAASMIATIELNSDPGMPPAQYRAFKMFGYGCAGLSMLATSQFPAALFMYWLPTNTLSCLQSVLLRQPSIREKLKLPLMDKDRKVLPWEQQPSYITGVPSAAEMATAVATTTSEAAASATAASAASASTPATPSAKPAAAAPTAPPAAPSAAKAQIPGNVSRTRPAKQQ